MAREKGWGLEVGSGGLGSKSHIHSLRTQMHGLRPWWECILESRAVGVWKQGSEERGSWGYAAGFHG